MLRMLACVASRVLCIYGLYREPSSLLFTHKKKVTRDHCACLLAAVYSISRSRTFEERVPCFSHMKKSDHHVVHACLLWVSETHFRAFLYHIMKKSRRRAAVI